jgi:hypothetical protein
MSPDIVKESMDIVNVPNDMVKVSMGMIEVARDMIKLIHYITSFTGHGKCSQLHGKVALDGVESR